MDSVEEAPFPPPAPAAVAPPPGPTAASFSGPTVFVLSPLPGNPYGVDRYFYSSAADVTEGDYAALLSFATHYGYPLAFYRCPDLATFQASRPSAVVWPFSEVPPAFIRRGYELQSSFQLSSSDASPASPSGGSAASFPSQCNDLASLLSHVSTVPLAQGSFRGHDPPLVAAATRTSSASVSSVGLMHPPPQASSACPDPDGVDVPPPFLGGAGGPGGPRFFDRSSSSYGYPPHRSSLGSGFSTSLMAAANYPNYNFPGPIPEEIPKVVFGWGHRPPLPHVMGGLMMLLLLLPHLPHVMGGLIRLLFLLRLGDIVMPLHLRRLCLRSQLCRTVLRPMAISLPLPCRT